MKKTTLILVLFLIISLIYVGCTPMPVTFPTIAPTATPQPTPIPPTATTQPTEVVLEGERYYEPEGGFSYIIPDGWEIFEIPGLKYLGLTESNPKGLFPSNVVFADERYDGSLEDYVDLTLINVKQVYPNLEVMNIDKVDTDSGIRGISVIVKNEFNSVQMIQILFMFDLEGKVLVMTYTMNIDEASENILAIGYLINSLQVDD
ncbi:MAG TPA: hypothetical protein PKY64_04315 [Anaerolineaceae bacterium]|nr:hypothetical protein [Anaerolineaceae bacterium]